MEEQPPSKKRKVRKGTHSCWECRRRKIKCHFEELEDTGSPTSSSAASQICIPCQARGTPCVSQQFADTTANAAGSSSNDSIDASASVSASSSGGGNGVRKLQDRGLAQRLGRLEEMMGSFVNSARGSNDSSPGDPSRRASADRLHGAAANKPRVSTVGAQPAKTNAEYQFPLPSPNESGTEELSTSAVARLPPHSSDADLLTCNSNGAAGGTATLNSGFPTPRSSDCGASQSCLNTMTTPSPHSYAAISKHLHSLIPSHTARVILAHYSPGAESVLSNFVSQNDRLDGKIPPASSLVDLPPATAHPAVLAKRLLQLAICLQQQLCPNAPMAELKTALGPKPWEDLMEEWVHAASTLVTSNDDLVGCQEGFECLVLQSYYHCEAGHLRKAWMTSRRALNMAQLMGADRRSDEATLVSVDPTSTSPPLQVSMLWWRINCCDRFISLLLGLPIGSRDNPPNSGPDKNESTQDRLAKQYSLFATKISDRNHIAQEPGKALEALALTHALDIEFEEVANDIGDAWWSMPNIVDAMSTCAVFNIQIMRLHLQQRHHVLLMLVHLPYLLRGRTDPRYGYNRAQCMKASRATLERFLEYRGVLKKAVVGRLVDYNALVAAMTLLLGHMRPAGSEGDDSANLSLKDDNKESDITLLETVRGVLQEVGDINNDRLTTEAAENIRDLLSIIHHHGTTQHEAAKRVGQSIPFLRTLNIIPISNANTAPTSPVAEKTTSSLQQQQQRLSGLDGSGTTPSNQVSTTNNNTAGGCSDYQSVGSNQSPFPLSFGDSVNFQAPSPAPGSHQQQLQQQQTMGNIYGMGNGNDVFPSMSWPPIIGDMDSNNWMYQGVDTTYWSMLNNTMN